MKVLLIGGHITPLLAVCQELQARNIRDLVAVSRATSLEGDATPAREPELLKQLSIPTRFITTGRLQRQFSLQTIPSLLKLPIGLWQAMRIVKQEKPDVVMSFGGYLAVPVVIAAKLAHIPVVIHEQSVRAGLANKFTARFATKVAISWEASRPYFPPEKIEFTGNPVRSEVFAADAVTPELIQLLQGTTSPIIYITGGNQGSHAINQIMFQLVPELIKRHVVIHQTGSSALHDDQAAGKLQALLPADVAGRYFPSAFFTGNDVGAILHRAWVVISRSGANTVTEVAACGIPAIFIPLPFAQENEQYENAKVLADRGGAIIVEQAQATHERIQQVLQEIESQYDTFKTKASQSVVLHITDAQSKLVDLLLAVSQKG